MMLKITNERYGKGQKKVYMNKMVVVSVKIQETKRESKKKFCD